MPCRSRNTTERARNLLAGVSVIAACSCSATSDDGDANRVAGGMTGRPAGSGTSTARGGAQSTGGSASGSGGETRASGGGPAGAAGSNPAGGGGSGAVSGRGSAAEGTGGGSAGAHGSALLFDDFEAHSLGAPDPSRWEVLTDSGSGTVEVSRGAARSGAQSVKIVAGGNYSDHAFLVNRSVFPLQGSVLFLRVWIRYESANWANHITFIKAIGTGGEELRLGGQAGFYHANLSQGDGLSPNPFVQPCPLCVAPQANQWICIEGLIAPAENRVQAWVDSKQAVDADAASDWHSGSGQIPVMLERLGFGWESYGAIGNTIYFDDLVLDDQRVGCD